MRTAIRLGLAAILAIGGLSLTSCKSERPEQQLAGEAGELCDISPERVCIVAGSENMTGDYIVSLHTVSGGDERRRKDLSCLATFARNKNFFLQTAPVARCRTREELDVADAASAACAVPARELWVDIPNSSARPSMSRSRPGGEDDDACLDQWAKGRGYTYAPYIRLD